MLVTKKIKLKLDNADKEFLALQADLCRILYNTALQQRIVTYRQKRSSLGIYTQKKELPLLKTELPEFKQVYNKCLSAALFRLDKAFKAFFSRVRQGKTPGFPRFKSRDHFFLCCLYL